jgi:hypothetical protein
LEDPKRTELRNLLSTFEADREQDRFREREKKIEKNRYVYRFEELTRSLILPTLRELILDLEKRGHLARLVRKSAERIRLDVQIEGQASRRCAVEIALHPSELGKVKIDYAWGWRSAPPETYLFEEVTAGLLAGFLLKLLKGLN